MKNSVSNLMEEHFDNYTVSPLFNKYFSLKTDDNVYKYRYEIISIINNIINDEKLIGIIAKQLSTKREITDTEAEDDVLLYLDKIKAVLEDVDKKQNQVNRKHNQYVSATLDRINYLKNRDEDFKGNIVNILKIISEDKENVMVDKVNKHKLLYNFKLYSNKALYKEKFKKPAFDGHAISAEFSIGNKDSALQKNMIIYNNKNKSIYKYRDRSRRFIISYTVPFAILSFCAISSGVYKISSFIQTTCSCIIFYLTIVF